MGKSQAKPKRVLVCGDYHSGAISGLTPPEYETGDSLLNGYAALRQACWKWFASRIDALRPFDVCIANGDLIDGPGARSGGTEQLTTDRSKQCKMAAATLRFIDAPQSILTIGTAYHTGQEEDWEEWIANDLKVKIGSHEWVDVNGLVFDVKHHLGSSSIPHGRHTAIAKDRLWNLLWADMGEQPKSDVIIRCLSEDTEILTEDGWRGCGDVNKGDKAVTLNKTTGQMEWGVVRAVTCQDSDTEMVQVSAKGVDALVTLDHRMFYRESNSKIWRVGPAKDLVGRGTYRLPVSGYLIRPGVNLPDSMICLLAWVIAEGNMDAGNSSKGYSQKNNVRLFQRTSKSHLIDEVLNDAGVSYTKNLRRQKGRPINDVDSGVTYYTKEDTYCFYLRQPHSRYIIGLLNGVKEIPDLLMDMNNHQFEIFLQAYAAGDGHIDRRAGTRLRGKIFTKSKQIADRLQILLVTNGYKSYVSTRAKWNSITYVIGFVKKQEVVMACGISPSRPRTSTGARVVPYTNKTWCVSVPNETLVVRRNGKVLIVGNSHVHYHQYVGGPDWLAMTLPALQAAATKYGARRCSGTVDFGFVVFDVNPDGSYKWWPEIARLPQQKATVFKC